MSASIPDEGQRRFALEVEAVEELSRGVFAGAIRKGIRFLAIKAAKPVAGRAVQSLAAIAEASRRPYRLRSFSAEDYRHPAGPEAGRPARSQSQA